MKMTRFSRCDSQRTPVIPSCDSSNTQIEETQMNKHIMIHRSLSTTHSSLSRNKRLAHGQGTRHGTQRCLDRSGRDGKRHRRSPARPATICLYRWIVHIESSGVVSNRVKMSDVAIAAGVSSIILKLQRSQGRMPLSRMQDVGDCRESLP